MRNWSISAILVVALLMMPLPTAAAVTPYDVTIQVDQNVVKFPDAMPFIDSQRRVQVPVRFLSEELGYQIEWSKKDNTVSLTLTKEDVLVQLQTGSSTAIVNGANVEIGTEPQLESDRVYVPMRFLSELRGMAVTWNDDNQLAILHQPDEPVVARYTAPKWKVITDVKASAYTAAKLENGEYGARDYMGNKLSLGTVAVDPDVIPLGSTLYIEGYDFDGLPAGGMSARATDVGGAVQGKKIDIFLPMPRSEAMKFGIQYVKVYVLEE